MDAHKAAITLLPHVVCDHDEMDDDLRYLARVRSMMPNDYKSRVHLVENDPGFIGIKQYMMECDLVIAARMHCAINAVAAQVPALILAYSNKAIGMGHYIYGNDDWTMSLGAFSSDAIVERVAACLERIETFRAEAPDRLALIRLEAYGVEAPL
jgi:polysaccharide pyruvyl transferase WcaK-like protein